MLLDELRKRLDAGDSGAPSEIERAVAARRAERGGHLDWALLCERAGLVGLAFSEFQLAVRDEPENATALWHLAQHYRERGDANRALGLLDRLLEREPARDDWLKFYVELCRDEDAAPRGLEAVNRAVAFGLSGSLAVVLRRMLLPQDSPTPPRAVGASPARQPGEFVPTDADCIRFNTLFSGREDVHARQWAKRGGETGYTPVREPLTPAVVRNHLLGTYTVGAYVLRLDATATFFALDLDIDKAALAHARGNPEFAQSLRQALTREGLRLLALLRDLGFRPLFENSGYKGRHLWVFLEQPAPAEALHLLGRQLLAWQSPLLAEGLRLEFFPKQASLKGQGLGNLIKLPLGIHRRTGYRSLFLDDQGAPVAQQLGVLQQVERASADVLRAAIERLKGIPAAEAAPFDDAPAAGKQKSAGAPIAAPPPPDPAPLWTEADFDSDPRVSHLLRQCPVLAELKRTVDEHRRLSHEEQLVLIHSLGHIDGGPQAVNYLFGKCMDVGPEKLMKDRLKGNPVSCPSIRKKVPQVTRRVACNCPFEFAADRYPTPVLHLLTLPADTQAPRPLAATGADPADLARRFGALERRRAEIEAEWQALRRSLISAVSQLPERELPCEGGRYRVEVHDGIEELTWIADPCTPSS